MAAVQYIILHIIGFIAATAIAVVVVIIAASTVTVERVCVCVFCGTCASFSIIILILTAAKNLFHDFNRVSTHGLSKNEQQNRRNIVFLSGRIWDLRLGYEIKNVFALNKYRERARETPSVEISEMRNVVGIYNQVNPDPKCVGRVCVVAVLCCLSLCVCQKCMTTGNPIRAHALARAYNNNKCATDAQSSDR